MTAISIEANPNFPSFWKVTNHETNEEVEVESRAKAVRVAMRIARRIGEQKFVEKASKGWRTISIF